MRKKRFKSIMARILALSMIAGTLSPATVMAEEPVAEAAEEVLQVDEEGIAEDASYEAARPEDVEEIAAAGEDEAMAVPEAADEEVAPEVTETDDEGDVLGVGEIDTTQGYEIPEVSVTPGYFCATVKYDLIGKETHNDNICIFYTSEDKADEVMPTSSRAEFESVEDIMILSAYEGYSSPSGDKYFFDDVSTRLEALSPGKYVCRIAYRNNLDENYYEYYFLTGIEEFEVRTYSDAVSINETKTLAEAGSKYRSANLYFDFDPEFFNNYGDDAYQNLVMLNPDKVESEDYYNIVDYCYKSGSDYLISFSNGADYIDDEGKIFLAYRTNETAGEEDEYKTKYSGEYYKLDVVGWVYVSDLFKAPVPGPQDIVSINKITPVGLTGSKLWYSVNKDYEELIASGINNSVFTYRMDGNNWSYTVYGEDTGDDDISGNDIYEVDMSVAIPYADAEGYVDLGIYVYLDENGDVTPSARHDVYLDRVKLFNTMPTAGELISVNRIEKGYINSRVYLEETDEYDSVIGTTDPFEDYYTGFYYYSWQGYRNKIDNSRIMIDAQTGEHYLLIDNSFLDSEGKFSPVLKVRVESNDRYLDYESMSDLFLPLPDASDIAGFNEGLSEIGYLSSKVYFDLDEEYSELYNGIDYPLVLIRQNVDNTYDYDTLDWDGLNEKYYKTLSINNYYVDEDGNITVGIQTAVPSDHTDGELVRYTTINGKTNDYKVLPLESIKVLRDMPSADQIVSINGIEKGYLNTRITFDVNWDLDGYAELFNGSVPSMYYYYGDGSDYRSMYVNEAHPVDEYGDYIYDVVDHYYTNLARNDVVCDDGKIRLFLRTGNGNRRIEFEPFEYEDIFKPLPTVSSNVIRVDETKTEKGYITSKICITLDKEYAELRGGEDSAPEIYFYDKDGNRIGSGTYASRDNEDDESFYFIVDSTLADPDHMIRFAMITGAEIDEKYVEYGVGPYAAFNPLPKASEVMTLNKDETGKGFLSSDIYMSVDDRYSELVQDNSRLGLIYEVSGLEYFDPYTVGYSSDYSYLYYENITRADRKYLGEKDQLVFAVDTGFRDKDGKAEYLKSDPVDVFKPMPEKLSDVIKVTRVEDNYTRSVIYLDVEEGYEELAENLYFLTDGTGIGDDTYRVDPDVIELEDPHTGEKVKRYVVTVFRSDVYGTPVSGNSVSVNMGVNTYETEGFDYKFIMLRSDGLEYAADVNYRTDVPASTADVISINRIDRGYGEVVITFTVNDEYEDLIDYATLGIVKDGKLIAPANPTGTYGEYEVRYTRSAELDKDEVAIGFETVLEDADKPGTPLKMELDPVSAEFKGQVSTDGNGLVTIGADTAIGYYSSDFYLEINDEYADIFDSGDYELVVKKNDGTYSKDGIDRSAGKYRFNIDRNDINGYLNIEDRLVFAVKMYDRTTSENKVLYKYAELKPLDAFKELPSIDKLLYDVKAVSDYEQIGIYYNYDLTYNKGYGNEFFNDIYNNPVVLVYTDKKGNERFLPLGDTGYRFQDRVIEDADGNERSVRCTYLRNYDDYDQFIQDGKVTLGILTGIKVKRDTPAENDPAAQGYLSDYVIIKGIELPVQPKSISENTASDVIERVPELDNIGFRSSRLFVKVKDEFKDYFLASKDAKVVVYDKDGKLKTLQSTDNGSDLCYYVDVDRNDRFAPDDKVTFGVRTDLKDGEGRYIELAKPVTVTDVFKKLPGKTSEVITLEETNPGYITSYLSLYMDPEFYDSRDEVFANIDKPLVFTYKYAEAVSGNKTELKDAIWDDGIYDIMGEGDYHACYSRDSRYINDGKVMVSARIRDEKGEVKYLEPVSAEALFKNDLPENADDIFKNITLVKGYNRNYIYFDLNNEFEDMIRGQQGLVSFIGGREVVSEHGIDDEGRLYVTYDRSNEDRYLTEKDGKTYVTLGAKINRVEDDAYDYTILKTSPIEVSYRGEIPETANTVLHVDREKTLSAKGAGLSRIYFTVDAEYADMLLSDTSPALIRVEVASASGNTIYQKLATYDEFYGIGDGGLYKYYYVEYDRNFCYGLSDLDSGKLSLYLRTNVYDKASKSRNLELKYEPEKSEDVEYRAELPGKLSDIVKFDEDASEYGYAFARKYFTVDLSYEDVFENSFNDDNKPVKLLYHTSRADGAVYTDIPEYASDPITYVSKIYDPVQDKYFARYYIEANYGNDYSYEALERRKAGIDNLDNYKDDKGALTLALVTNVYDKAESWSEDYNTQQKVLVSDPFTIGFAKTTPSITTQSDKSIYNFRLTGKATGLYMLEEENYSALVHYRSEVEGSWNWCNCPITIDPEKKTDGTYEGYFSYHMEDAEGIQDDYNFEYYVELIDSRLMWNPGEKLPESQKLRAEYAILATDGTASEPKKFNTEEKHYDEDQIGDYALTVKSVVTNSFGAQFDLDYYSYSVDNLYIVFSEDMDDIPAGSVRTIAPPSIYSANLSKVSPRNGQYTELDGAKKFVTDVGGYSYYDHKSLNPDTKYYYRFAAKVNGLYDEFGDYADYHRDYDNSLYVFLTDVDSFVTEQEARPAEGTQVAVSYLRQDSGINSTRVWFTVENPEFEAIEDAALVYINGKEEKLSFFRNSYSSGSYASGKGYVDVYEENVGANTKLAVSVGVRVAEKAGSLDTKVVRARSEEFVPVFREVEADLIAQPTMITTDIAEIIATLTPAYKSDRLRATMYLRKKGDSAFAIYEPENNSFDEAADEYGIPVYSWVLDFVPKDLRAATEYEYYISITDKSREDEDAAELYTFGTEDAPKTFTTIDPDRVLTEKDFGDENLYWYLAKTYGTITRADTADDYVPATMAEAKELWSVTLKAGDLENVTELNLALPLGNSYFDDNREAFDHWYDAFESRKGEAGYDEAAAALYYDEEGIFRGVNINKPLTSLKGIELLPQLSTLTVKGQAIDNLDGIEKMLSLSSLTVNYTDLAAIPDMSGMVNLRSLDLKGNKLTESGFSAQKLPAVFTQNLKFVAETLAAQQTEVSLDAPATFYNYTDTDGNAGYPFFYEISGLNPCRRYVIETKAGDVEIAPPEEVAGPGSKWIVISNVNDIDYGYTEKNGRYVPDDRSLGVKNGDTRDISVTVREITSYKPSLTGNGDEVQPADRDVLAQTVKAAFADKESRAFGRKTYDYRPKVVGTWADLAGRYKYLDKSAYDYHRDSLAQDVTYVTGVKVVNAAKGTEPELVRADYSLEQEYGYYDHRYEGRDEYKDIVYENIGSYMTYLDAELCFRHNLEAGTYNLVIETYKKGQTEAEDVTGEIIIENRFEVVGDSTDPVLGAVSNANNYVDAYDVTGDYVYVGVSGVNLDPSKFAPVLTYNGVAYTGEVKAYTTAESDQEEDLYIYQLKKADNWSRLGEGEYSFEVALNPAEGYVYDDRTDGDVYADFVTGNTDITINFTYYDRYDRSFEVYTNTNIPKGTVVKAWVYEGRYEEHKDSHVYDENNPLEKESGYLASAISQVDEGGRIHFSFYGRDNDYFIFWNEDDRAFTIVYEFVLGGDYRLISSVYEPGWYNYDNTYTDDVFYAKAGDKLAIDYSAEKYIGSYAEAKKAVALLRRSSKDAGRILASADLKLTRDAANEFAAKATGELEIPADLRAGIYYIQYLFDGVWYDDCDKVYVLDGRFYEDDQEAALYYDEEDTTRVRFALQGPALATAGVDAQKAWEDGKYSLQVFEYDVPEVHRLSDGRIIYDEFSAISKEEIETDEYGNPFVRTEDGYIRCKEVTGFTLGNFSSKESEISFDIDGLELEKCYYFKVTKDGEPGLDLENFSHDTEDYIYYYESGNNIDDLNTRYGEREYLSEANVIDAVEIDEAWMRYETTRMLRPYSFLSILDKDESGFDYTVVITEPDSLVPVKTITLGRDKVKDGVTEKGEACKEYDLTEADTKGLTYGQVYNIAIINRDSELVGYNTGYVAAYGSKDEEKVWPEREKKSSSSSSKKTDDSSSEQKPDDSSSEQKPDDSSSGKKDGTSSSALTPEEEKRQGDNRDKSAEKAKEIAEAMEQKLPTRNVDGMLNTPADNVSINYVLRKGKVKSATIGTIAEGTKDNRLTINVGVKLNMTNLFTTVSGDGIDQKKAAKMYKAKKQPYQLVPKKIKGKPVYDLYLSDDKGTQLRVTVVDVSFNKTALKTMVLPVGKTVSTNELTAAVKVPDNTGVVMSGTESNVINISTLPSEYRFTSGVWIIGKNRVIATEDTVVENIACGKATVNARVDKRGFLTIASANGVKGNVKVTYMLNGKKYTAKVGIK